ncbi:hypothetical protein ACFPK5_00865 [Streptomyces beijiangensis]|uniref:hypothetical protein n=1 Tax=Streptomyces beijiangensis TaxID=163361 RepID=UPI0031E0DC8C
MTGPQRLVRWLTRYVVDVDGIRLMIHQPRQWALARGHHPWTGLVPLALLAAGAYTGWLQASYPMWTLAVIYGALSFGTDLVGGRLHTLWDRGRIWQDTICPCCDEHGPGGWFDSDLTPDDGPEDHGRRPDGSHRPALHTVTTPREWAAQAAYAALTLEGLR